MLVSAVRDVGKRGKKTSWRVCYVRFLNGTVDGRKEEIEKGTEVKRWKQREKEGGNFL